MVSPDKRCIGLIHCAIFLSLSAMHGRAVLWRKTDGGKWERKEKKENGNGNGNLREGRKGGGEGSERRDPDEREGNDERTRDCEEA